MKRSGWIPLLILTLVLASLATAPARAQPGGACCPDCVLNGCAITSESECVASGGTYQGDGSECVVADGVTVGYDDLLSPAIDIPDNDPAGLSRSIVVPFDDCVVGDLDVGVLIDHLAIGNLEISLTHEDTGTSVTLWNHDCGASNQLDATFDDGSPATLCGAPAAATVGGMSPAGGSLSEFDLEPCGGTWTLNVVDLDFVEAELPGCCFPGMYDPYIPIEGVIETPVLVEAEAWAAPELLFPEVGIEIAFEPCLPTEIISVPFLATGTLAQWSLSFTGGTPACDQPGPIISTSSNQYVSTPSGGLSVRHYNAYEVDPVTGEWRVVLNGQALGLTDLDCVDRLQGCRVAFSTKTNKFVAGQTLRHYNAYVLEPDGTITLGIDGAALGLQTLDACSLP